MRIKRAAKDGLTFTGGVLLFVIQLFLWRIAFTIIAGVIMIALLFGGGFAYGVAAALGLSSSISLLLGIVGLGAFVTCIGAIAGHYGYDSPRVNVSFTKPTGEKE